MIRFIIWSFIFLIIGGFILHYDIQIPWLTQWIGTLPGDFIIKNKKILIYFPVTSALLASFIFSVITSIIFKKK